MALKGIRISIYIDDILIIASSAKQAATLLAVIRNSLESLGFLVNIKKSHVTPTTRITYLGFEIDSVAMKLFLPISKISRIIQSCKNLLQNSNPTIREIAHVAGLIVSALPAVRYLQLHYRSIEFCKSQALLAGRDYDDHSCLDINSRFDLLWIIQNIATFNGKVFQEPEINLFVNSDASLTGWGASCNGQTTGGRWSLSESNNHINFLELLAAFLALQSFVSQSNIHVRLKLDNTTAVSYINNMGGIRSEPLNTLAKKIWHWCMSREIWLSAQYVPGDLNAEADSASRLFSEDLEWSLHPTIFSELHSTIWSPDIDLFASRLNFKVEKYVSWHPDPGAYAVDAFSLSWSNMGCYIFPPFSLISRILAKVRRDKAVAILIAPVWPTQGWYPVPLHSLVQLPVLLPQWEDLLVRPHNQEFHPLRFKMRLAAWVVSGNPSQTREFLLKLPTLSVQAGQRVQKNSTKRFGKSGEAGAVKGMSIPFRLMFHKC